jgi:hypothetical protein
MNYHAFIFYVKIFLDGKIDLYRRTLIPAIDALASQFQNIKTDFVILRHSQKICGRSGHTSMGAGI